jgi:hypothetical protein
VNITIPDRHPGRCCNLRISRHRPGVYLRCLDYEGTPHVCTFEADSPPRLQYTGWGLVYTDPKPKPWVKPGADIVKATIDKETT